MYVVTCVSLFSSFPPHWKKQDRVRRVFLVRAGNKGRVANLVQNIYRFSRPRRKQRSSLSFSGNQESVSVKVSLPFFFCLLNLLLIYQDFALALV